MTDHLTPWSYDKDSRSIHNAKGQHPLSILYCDRLTADFIIQCVNNHAAIAAIAATKEPTA
jgi:hypothetical protein